MTANLFSGLGEDYSRTIPAGQVGFCCSHAAANSFDNFYIRDQASLFEIDGHWFGNCGDIQVDAGSQRREPVRDSHLAPTSAGIPSGVSALRRSVASSLRRFTITANPPPKPTTPNPRELSGECQKGV